MSAPAGRRRAAPGRRAVSCPPARRATLRGVARLLILIAHSTEEPNRAATALGTAQALQQEGHTVDLWLHGEGVRLGVAHVAETLREPWPTACGPVLDALAAAGSTFHCSEPCFQQRGFTADALRPGARLAPTAHLGRLLATHTPVTC